MSQPIENEPVLNELAWALVEDIVVAADDLRVEVHELSSGARVIDFGVDAPGSLAAGIALSEVCMAGLSEIELQQGTLNGIGWPLVVVSTDDPLEACLLSQYAGWAVQVGKFFGMGSGPMRAAACEEELFSQFDYREEAERAVGVLECGKLPGDEVITMIAEKCGVTPNNLTLLVAPTASVAGSFQVVARSVETCLHKLHELEFDTTRIQSAVGSAPFAPVAADDLAGIGRTNDAILYGGRVHLWVTGDDESLAAIGPKVPSSASDAYGEPFVTIFEQAGHDFYAIDKLLFSPAEVVFQNIDTGSVHVFGGTKEDVIAKSFGIAR
ncbi:MAG: methenyltetrahydromethanopterin cyclohydrolase [Planctomycetaceae bacterium]|nr:methenyltetrahydromethanopterin cyclohydrolase [Planctomycetaceae bacterium]